MVECKNHIEKTWWITKKTDNSVIHYGEVEVGNVVESGQEEIETFTSEEEWIDRLEELGITIEQ